MIFIVCKLNEMKNYINLLINYDFLISSSVPLSQSYSWLYLQA